MLQTQFFGDDKACDPGVPRSLVMTIRRLACAAPMDASIGQDRTGSKKRRRTTPQDAQHLQQTPPPPTRSGGSGSNEPRSPCPGQEERPQEVKKRRGRPPGKKGQPTAKKVRERQRDTATPTRHSIHTRDDELCVISNWPACTAGTSTLVPAVHITQSLGMSTYLRSA